jgi:hypothetical protein
MPWQPTNDEKLDIKIEHVGGSPLALFFTPDSIRAHFEGTEHADIVDAMSDDDLKQFGIDALFSDTLMEAFHRVLCDALGLEDE